MPDDARASRLLAVESDAELLVAEQLDLLAQVEAQVRAVHHTMRRIEKLRGAKYRVGPDLSNGQRLDTLQGLLDELRTLDAHLRLQHECGREMQATVERMQDRLKDLKSAAEQTARASEGAPRDEGEPPESGGSVSAP
jgi:DNA repair exonuclease SbcCD ATPase subunit